MLLEESPPRDQATSLIVVVLPSGYFAKHAARGAPAFHDCFMALRDVMYACFIFTLGASYHEAVTNIADCYERLNLSTTIKVYAFIRHVPEFFANHLKPLWHFCEPVVEQCHSKFDRILWGPTGAVKV